MNKLSPSLPNWILQIKSVAMFFVPFCVQVESSNHLKHLTNE